MNTFEEIKRLLAKHSNERYKEGFDEAMKRIGEVIDKITSWTCECNCVTFDNKICRHCGKAPKYGEIDYDELIEQLGLGKTKKQEVEK